MPQIPHTSRARVVPVFTHFFPGPYSLFFWSFIFWACLPGGPILQFGSFLDYLQKRVCFISLAAETYPLCLVYILMQDSVPFFLGGGPPKPNITSAPGHVLLHLHCSLPIGQVRLGEPGPLLHNFLLAKPSDT